MHAHVVGRDRTAMERRVEGRVEQGWRLLCTHVECIDAFLYGIFARLVASRMALFREGTRVRIRLIVGF